MASSIENTIFFEEIIRLLDSGSDVKIGVKGTSMLPFLKEGRDAVILRKPSDENQKNGIEVGSIVLAKHKGSYVLHRIYRIKGDQIELMGDANVRYGEIVNRKDIIACVTAVERGEKRIDITRSSYGFKSKVWIRTLPLRKPITILLSKIKGWVRS